MRLTNKHLDLYNAIKTRGISGGCNDILPEEALLLSKSEWQELCKSYHLWNGDIEEYVDTRPSMMDFMVVSFVEYLLLSSYKYHLARNSSVLDGNRNVDTKIKLFMRNDLKFEGTAPFFTTGQEVKIGRISGSLKRFMIIDMDDNVHVWCDMVDYNEYIESKLV